MAQRDDELPGTVPSGSPLRLPPNRQVWDFVILNPTARPEFAGFPGPGYDFCRRLSRRLPFCGSRDPAI
jgi:hypothetical protein